MDTVTFSMDEKVKYMIFLPLAAMCVENSTRLQAIFEDKSQKIREYFVLYRDAFEMMKEFVGDYKVRPMAFGITSLRQMMLRQMTVNQMTLDQMTLQQMIVH